MILITLLILILLIILLNKNISNFSNRNVIIIGNAPIKDENKYLGNKINEFSEVVRFNDFSLENYTQHIGTKIDTWVVSDHFILIDYDRFIKKYNNLKPKKVIVMVPTVFDYNIKKLKKKLGKLFYKLEVVKEKDVNKDYNFKNNWPSSGLLTILHYLKNYNQIHILGFNHFSKNEKKIHYYEDKGKLDVSKQIGHNPSLEKSIFENLIKNNKIINLHTS